MSGRCRGEPIVCTAEGAFRCFMGPEVEALAVGDSFLKTEDQDPALKLNYETAFELDYSKEYWCITELKNENPRWQHSPASSCHWIIVTSRRDRRIDHKTAELERLDHGQNGKRIAC